MIRIPLEGQTFHLLPERAALWEEEATLLITDPHFGKGATFRSHGLPIPAGSTESDLARLGRLIEAHRPRRLVILGDFFHTRESQSAATLEALTRWREGCPALEVLLVKGNHDRHAGAPPAALGIEVVEEPRLEGPFALCHHPCEHPGAYVLAGHVHPGITLQDRRGGKVGGPCFWFAARQGLLPAFGSFTGTAEITVSPTDRLFLLGPGHVVEIPARLACLGAR